MKKMCVVLLLLAVFISISAVSATENISASDSACEISEVEQDNIEVSISDDSNQNNTLSTDNAGDDSSQEIIQIPSKVSAKNIKSTYGNKAKFSLKVFNQNGSVIIGENVRFKVAGNVYNTKTDSNGIATLELNYDAGKYTINYYVGNLSGENTYTVSNNIAMKIFKWGNKGDISKVKLLKKNMPNNKWIKKAIKAAKKGNPLLKFKGGKGKIVFITAGVHGNELSSQVGVMKLIEYLSKTPIKGTVYIMPFVNIKAISKKVRHTGTDYNRVANKAGTISNKIVNLVVKCNADAYGDFHTTQPGGSPGKDIVMGSKAPAKKCNKLTKYIARYAKVNKRIYKYAGQQYPGALADNVNKKGIPAVICEVLLPHNTVTAKTVKTSYNMMIALLKFNSIV